jgi:FkbM family methyltransferase
MQSDLIFDIGACEGNDTAYYLSRAFRVVAVEANPSLVSQLETRFAQEAESGSLTIVGACITVAAGETSFWVCDDVNEWSSCHLDIASRENAKHHAVTVPGVCFRALLENYGVPFYCKIDIEGNDRLCLQELTATTKPMFVSFEMPHSDADVDLEILRSLGYTRFKVVSQVSRAQPVKFLSQAAAALPAGGRDLLLRLDRRLRGKYRAETWIFPFGSSGAFGEDTPGPWRSSTYVLETWRYLKEIDRDYGLRGMGDWHDIHAAL